MRRDITALLKAQRAAAAAKQTVQKKKGQMVALYREAAGDGPASSIQVAAARAALVGSQLVGCEP